MTFEEILDQAIAMLQRRGRLTYGALKRQFQLDDAYLEDLKAELLYAYPQVRDDAGRGLAWTGDPSSAPLTALAPQQQPQPGTPRLHATVSGRENPHHPQALEGDANRSRCCLRTSRARQN